jgi:hypothetical protein
VTALMCLVSSFEGRVLLLYALLAMMAAEEDEASPTEVVPIVVTVLAFFLFLGRRHMVKEKWCRWMYTRGNYEHCTATYKMECRVCGRDVVCVCVCVLFILLYYALMVEALL